MYPMLTIIRLFEAFSSQPRLATFTKALSLASVTLSHFLLVSCSVFFTYAIVAVVLFGRELDDFTTGFRSIFACFRTLMTIFDWEELQRIGHYEAGFWLATFLVILCGFMLNLLTAILVDAYTEVKATVDQKDTIFTEALQMLFRFRGRYRGELIPLERVLTGLREFKGSVEACTATENSFRRIVSEDSENVSVSTSIFTASSTITGQTVALETNELITVESFTLYCPGIKREQVKHILENTVVTFWIENKETSMDTEMLQVIRKVNHETRDLRHRVVDMNTMDTNTGNLVGMRRDRAGFFEELEACKLDLRIAQEFIATDEVCEYVPPGGESLTETELVQVQNMHDVREWNVVQIHHEANFVFQSCRDAGISDEHDESRGQAVGRTARVLQRDHHDSTVKVRVPDVGDVWLSLPCIRVWKTAIKRPVMVYPSTSVLEELTTEPLEVQRNHPAPVLVVPQLTDESSVSTRSSEDEGRPSSIADKVEKLAELETELRVGRQTVTDALRAVSELEWRLLQEYEEQGKISLKFQNLKKKVVALTKENRRILDEVRLQAERFDVIQTSKNECEQLVATMEEENQRLKAELADPEGTRPRDDAEAAGERPLMDRVERLAKRVESRRRTRQTLE